MACTLETLGNRTLMQFHAARDTPSPIKAIRVTKIANLDVIFILTVVNHGLDALHDELNVALRDCKTTACITVSDTPYLLSANVMVISVRAPINNGLELFHAVVKVLQNRCEYFTEIEEKLAELIGNAHVYNVPNPNETNLQKLHQYLQTQILQILCAQEHMNSLESAQEYVNLWNSKQLNNLTPEYAMFVHAVHAKFVDHIKEYATTLCGSEQYLIPKMFEQIKRLITDTEAQIQQSFMNTLVLSAHELRRIWDLAHPAAEEPKVKLSII